MDLRKPLGNKIRQFRKIRGLTQEQLAVKIGIETNTLSNIETEFFIYDENVTMEHKKELAAKIKNIKNSNLIFLIENIINQLS